MDEDIATHPEKECGDSHEHAGETEGKPWAAP